MTTLCHVNLARGFRGGERQTELLIRELASRGYRQRLLARADQPLVSRLARVPGLETIPVAKPFIRHVRWLRGGLIHAHEAKAAHLAYWANCAFATPYLLTRRVDRTPSGNPLTRGVYRRAAAVVAISKAIRAVLSIYQPDINISLIPSAHAGLSADPDAVRCLRASWGGRLIVGQVGALTDRHKGQSVLIAAARQLAPERPDWRFVLVGGGADEAALRKQAAGLHCLHFAGEQNAVGNYLAAFDLFAMPSRYEGLGSALLDAFSFGLPTVASRVGGIPELVRDGIEGLLCPPGCADALANQIRRLGDNAELRAEMSRAAKNRAQAFTVGRMATDYLVCYRRCGVELA